MAIDRRGFLGYAALGSALALAKPLTAVAQASSPAATPELEEITLGELQDGMKSGRWTARSIPGCGCAPKVGCSRRHI